VKEKGDLWADFWKKSQRLEDAINLLSGNLATVSTKGAYRAS